jgi:hypothetical protein
MGKLNRRGADAARTAVHQKELARFQRPDLKHISPHSEKGFRNARRLLHRQALRDRQTMTRRHTTVLGVAAAGNERSDALAELERCACAEGGDLP